MRMTLLAVALLAASPVARAAGGWYLLVPPRSEYNEQAPFTKGYKILDDKPLSQWGQVAAFDSASGCEATKGALLMAEQKMYQLDQQDYTKALEARKDASTLNLMRWNAEVHNGNITAYMAGRCIRSDDPRLRKK